MKWFALVGVLFFAACNQAGISSEFRKSAQSAYSLIEQMVYEHPVSQTDLSKAIADADASAHSQKEHDIVFALKSGRNYVSGVSKNGMSCLIAAREMLKGENDAQKELTSCKTEVGQQ